MMNNARFDKGMRTLKEIDGIHGEEVYTTLHSVSPALADLLVETFGDIYTRPELTVQERELITLSSLLTAGGCEAQLKVHTNAALRVGVAPEKILEICIHCIPYTGFPRVLNAVFTVQSVFEERGLL